MQSTVRFDNVYVSPRVRVALHSVLETQYTRKFWDLLNKLRSGQFNTPGMRVERLHCRQGKIYSARINVDMRVIFSMYSSKQTGQRSLVIWDANHHDAAYDRVERTTVPVVFQPTNNFLEPEQIWSEQDAALDELSSEAPDSEEITNGLLLFRVPYYVLSDPGRYRSFEKNIDRYLRLSEEQEDLLKNTDRAYLVRGAAGTGKTSLALFYALSLYEHSPEDDIYFFTYHDELACVCRCYKTNLVEEQGGKIGRGDFHVFSYLEFCRHYLRKHLESKDLKWQWIDRAASIKHLTEIIGARARWARTLRADNLYSYIYSILKGRFVPGSDRLPNSADDFRRIFKGYGSVPENLEEILEIFGHYEERLSRLRQKDEADLIRYCYQTLKEKAVLSEDGKATWIIIDELQDFTELEWKSILLFWENQCLSSKSTASYPFLCGDRNQNISRSGFRWQEVDSYVESILRKVHRPNAVEKVQLHRNFRNTKEIYDFAVFIHALTPNAGGDMGTAPELFGRKPQVIVGDYDEFVQFLGLLNDPLDEQLPAPLVVLSEDNEALSEMGAAVEHDDGLFFMPLQTSKGLEFEDLIIYRLFSSLEHFGDEEFSEDSAGRLFDLWYMAITRARQNLLIFLTPEDLRRLKHRLGTQFKQFLKLVDLHTADIQSHLLNFYHQRERYLPNYAVVFLERTKAGECWEQYRRLLKEKQTQRAAEFKEKAIKLWKRCRDSASLGRAYVELGEYSTAIPHLRQASLFSEVAACYEHLGKFERAATFYQEDGMAVDAARCYEKAKQYDLAARIYEQQEEFLQAASNYYLAGDNLKAAVCFEKVSMWKSAADLYRVKSNWQKAAELYLKCDDLENAAEMYLKLKDRLDAARCYAKAKMPLKAAALYEQLMRWTEAADCYEQGDNYDKAGALYTKAGRLKDAARCKEKSGDVASAAAAYERMKQWDKAANAYVELKQPAKAAECFEKEGNWEQALTQWTMLNDFSNTARCLENLGRIQEAAENYAHAGAHNESGRAYEKMENWAEAADQYLKANNFGAAASMLARLGRRLDAARLYLVSGQAAVAVEVASPKGTKADEQDLRDKLVAWVEQNKKLELAAALYEALGDYIKAADKYKQSMNLSKAAECAEKGASFEQAAEFYLQEGKFEKAAHCFAQGRQIKRAAQCYEMLKRWTDARRLYEEINDSEGVKRCETAANWL